MTTSPIDSKTTERPDRELLTSYVRDGDQPAFTQLVRRHAGLVMGVCRRTTRDSHHAEDAFQATFMVLAKNARKVRNPDALSSWLHGVAYRTSLRLNRKLNRKTMRQLSKNVNEEQMVVSGDPFEKLTNQFANQKTDEELHQLPEQLRTPMVLRYLSGKSNAEIADQLGLSVSAVEGRLKRAKSKLRARLMRHGISVGAVVAALAVTRKSEAAIPESLIESTIQNSLSFHSSCGTPLDPAAEQVAKLASEEAIAMSILSSSNLAVVACSAAIIMTGIGLTPLITSADAANGNGGSIRTTTSSADDSNAETVVRVTASDNPFATADEDEANTSSGDDPFDFGDGDESSTDTDPSGFDDGSAAKDNKKPTTATKPTRPVEVAKEIRFFDVKKRSATELKIETQLSTETRLDFLDTPLSEAIEYFEELHQINIEFDSHALDELGIGSDTAVKDRTMSGIPLGDALDLVLRDLDLTWVPTKHVLLITTPDQAASMAENRVYPIPTEWNVSAAELQETIVKNASPSSWEEVGGEGAISLVGESLVIRQTYRAHNEITDLLSQLESSMKQTTTDANASNHQSR
ncbi:RNA polymerase sigma factor [Planctomycetota bacterium]